MKSNVLGTGDPRALFAYITVCIVWGSTYLAIRVGVSDLPPALFAGIRFVVAGLILFAYAWLRGLAKPGSWREVRISATVGLFLLFGGNGLVVWSEQWIVSSLAALLIATVPLFVALLDTIVPGGKGIGKIGWAGLLVGFSGVALLMAPGINMGGNHLAGLIGILGASFLWASGSVYSTRKPVSGSIIYNIAIQCMAAGLVLSLTGVLIGETGRFHLTLPGLWALLYLIFFGSLSGYSAYIYILKVMPPAKASTYAYVNPVVAVILGFFILNEPVTVRTLAAAAVILGGVLLVQMSRTKPAVSNAVEAETGGKGKIKLVSAGHGVKCD